MQLVAAALAIVAISLGAPSALADKPPGVRVGLRAGIESSSTVSSRSSEALELLGIDVDVRVDRFVVGAELNVAGSAFGHGTVAGGLHGGVQILTSSVHAMAVGALGIESISHICSGCESVTMPYAEVLGVAGVALGPVEIGLWAAGSADLGRDHVASTTTVDAVGGFGIGGGLTLAYLSR